MQEILYCWFAGTKNDQWPLASVSIDSLKLSLLTVTFTDSIPSPGSGILFCSRLSQKMLPSMSTKTCASIATEISSPEVPLAKYTSGSIFAKSSPLMNRVQLPGMTYIDRVPFTSVRTMLPLESVLVIFMNPSKLIPLIVSSTIVSPIPSLDKLTSICMASTVSRVIANRLSSPDMLTFCCKISVLLVKLFS